jgi:hypothetical protein
VAFFIDGRIIAKYVDDSLCRHFSSVHPKRLRAFQ